LAGYRDLAAFAFGLGELLSVPKVSSAF
jgi:hypothetical protein